MPLYKMAMPVSVVLPMIIIINMGRLATVIMRVKETESNSVEDRGQIWCTTRHRVSRDMRESAHVQHCL